MVKVCRISTDFGLPSRELYGWSGMYDPTEEIDGVSLVGLAQQDRQRIKNNAYKRKWKRLKMKQQRERQEAMRRPQVTGPALRQMLMGGVK